MGYEWRLHLQVIKLCQMRSVHANPSLLPGEVCACNSSTFARWNVCLQALPFCMVVYVCKSFALPGWMCACNAFTYAQWGVCMACNSFTFARWCVGVQVFHFCQIGGVPAIPSHVPDWVCACSGFTFARLVCVGAILPLGCPHKETPTPPVWHK